MGVRVVVAGTTPNDPIQLDDESTHEQQEQQLREALAKKMGNARNARLKDHHGRKALLAKVAQDKGKASFPQAQWPAWPVPIPHQRQ